MKTRNLFLLIILVIFSSTLYSQGITNEGATIVITGGADVTITNGGYYNESNGTRHGRIDLDNGLLWVYGDFENNVTDPDEHVFINVGTDGYVVMRGTGDQHISNSTPNAYIDFERLYIYGGSNTMLDAGSSATVNGTLTVASGATFTLSSPPDGEGPSGSLITVGTVSGTGSLYVDRHYETAGRYVYFSAPVNNATDDMFDNTLLPNNFNPNLYNYTEGYDAPTDPTGTAYTNWSDPTYAFYDAWNQVAVDGSTVGLTAGAGYITYNERELDIEYGGSPSNLNVATSYSPSVSYTLNDANSGYYDGWNLVGNPYPCALDWDDVNWTKTNISNTIYLWNGNNYIYYNNGFPEDHLEGSGQTINSDADARYIPAMQSFMVKASGAPTLTIPDDARVHYVKDLYKKTENEYTFNYLKLRTEHEGFSDETIVRFFEEATDNVDDAFDAYKMFPWSTPAMIYSLTQNEEIPVSINSLPVRDIGTSIPIGFLSEDAGTFTIIASEFQFDPSVIVKFIDKSDHKEIIVNEDFEYSFSYEGGENRDRFYLFVAPIWTDIDEENIDIEANTKVWSSDNKIFITVSSYELLDSRVEVFDVLGRSVIQERLTGNYNVINVPGASGTYFVKLITNNGMSSLDKVYINK